MILGGLVWWWVVCLFWLGWLVGYGSCCLLYLCYVLEMFLLWFGQPRLALGWSCGWGMEFRVSSGAKRENAEKSQIWKGYGYVEESEIPTVEI